MKKLLILLIIPLLLGGCYDYNELNELAIVSGVGIDYVNDEYEVTFEILSTKKEGDNSSSSSAYTVSAKGKTVTEAFAHNGSNLDKVPYYDHIEVVVISEDIAREHLKEVSEYLIRSSKFRNEFYITVAKNNSAKDIISATSKEKPVASTFIVSMLENNNDSESAAYYEPFTKTLRKMLTGGEDAMMSVFKLDDDKIVLEGLGVFKGFELKYIFDTDEASIINLLNNFKAKTVFFKKSCGNDKSTVISIYEGNVEITPNNENLEVKLKLNARVNEDNCGYDFKKEDTYDYLQKEFTNIIQSKIDGVLMKLQYAESNALSIGKNYYNKYRDKNYELWMKQDFQYEIDLKINKKGLIFEVK